MQQLCSNIYIRYWFSIYVDDLVNKSSNNSDANNFNAPRQYNEQY